jgi:hypothetical protein
MEIRLARHGRHVAVVTIDNQPRLNAMTRQMLNELGRLWDELERDGDCRCIILTGAGQLTASCATLPAQRLGSPVLARIACVFLERGSRWRRYRPAVDDQAAGGVNTIAGDRFDGRPETQPCARAARAGARTAAAIETVCPDSR